MVNPASLFNIRRDPAQPKWESSVAYLVPKTDRLPGAHIRVIRPCVYHPSYDILIRDALPNSRIVVK